MYQFRLVIQSCPTLYNPMDCSMPGFSVDYQLLELAETHVHQVGDSIQPSYPLSSPSTPHISCIHFYFILLKVKMKVFITQSCLTLCESMDCSPPGFSVHGILQAIYWSGLPFPPPGDPLQLEIKPGSPALQEDFFFFFLILFYF